MPICWCRIFHVKKAFRNNVIFVSFNVVGNNRQIDVIIKNFKLLYFLIYKDKIMINEKIIIIVKDADPITVPVITSPVRIPLN